MKWLSNPNLSSSSVCPEKKKEKKSIPNVSPPNLKLQNEPK